MTEPALPTANLPGSVKFAVWLTFLNSWILFEEIVVDRQGLSRYMPFYRVGRFCPWDVAAMVIFALVVRRALRPAPVA